MILVEPGVGPQACIHWTPDAPGQRPPAAFLRLLLQHGAQPNRPHGGFSIATKRIIPFLQGLSAQSLAFEQSLYPTLKNYAQKRIC